MSYLIDTSWAVEWLRQNQEVIKRLRAFESEGLAISTISVAELYRGVFRSRIPSESERVLQEFLRGVTVVGIDEQVARIFGSEEAVLRRRGDLIGEFDLLIAATALRHDLILLTKDSDFERVENLQTIFL